MACLLWNPAAMLTICNSMSPPLGENGGTFYKTLISSGCPSDLIMSKGPAHGLLSIWPELIFSGYSPITPPTHISLHADWPHSFCKNFHGLPCSMPLLLLFPPCGNTFPFSVWLVKSWEHTVVERDQTLSLAELFTSLPSEYYVPLAPHLQNDLEMPTFEGSCGI